MVVLKYVLIAAVHRELIGTARTADRRLEATIRGNRIIGEYAPVAPTADREPRCICNTQCNEIISTRQEIFNFLVAPIGGDRLGECSTAAAAAPIVDAQHHESPRCKHLRLELIAI